MRDQLAPLPTAQLSPGTYFVTAGTHRKEHFFQSPLALDEVQELFFQSATAEKCSLQAWCFLSNHYHVVVQMNGAGDLQRLIRRFHSTSAKALNTRDGARGRQVWFQFRETELTFERSWLARLRYTNENAVHHQLVQASTQYRWGSARSFEERATPAFNKTLRSVRMDRVKVLDEFDAAAPLPF